VNSADTVLIVGRGPSGGRGFCADHPKDLAGTGDAFMLGRD